MGRRRGGWKVGGIRLEEKGEGAGRTAVEGRE
jgi:hypothetical protein